jgi:uncharacterized protein (TIGR04255 family)
LNINLRFPLPQDRGALHVTYKHGKKVSDKKDVLILDLTARGPAKLDGSDMEDWFDLAHEWIVRGFTDLTSALAHKRWGRMQ